MTSSLPVDPVFQLILDLSSRRPGPEAPFRLTELFRELSETEPSRPAEEIEDLIWTIWASHEDREAEEAMGAAIDAMASGLLQEAQPLLDHLVSRYSGWAEAWNKRATLAYIEMRDADSLQDIRRTLELEPRHFGAVSGFGEICLRNGHLNEARAAFQVALSINPHLEGLRDVLEDLAPQNLMLH
jgi:tetratricopeptide (TPR) repeat protein